MGAAGVDVPHQFGECCRDHNTGRGGCVVSAQSRNLTKLFGLYWVEGLATQLGLQVKHIVSLTYDKQFNEKMVKVAVATGGNAMSFTYTRGIHYRYLCDPHDGKAMEKLMHVQLGVKECSAEDKLHLENVYEGLKSRRGGGGGSKEGEMFGEALEKHRTATIDGGGAVCGPQKTSTERMSLSGVFSFYERGYTGEADVLVGSVHGSRPNSTRATVTCWISKADKTLKPVYEELLKVGYKPVRQTGRINSSFSAGGRQSNLSKAQKSNFFERYSVKFEEYTSEALDAIVKKTEAEVNAMQNKKLKAA